MFSYPLCLHSCSRKASSMSIRAVEARKSILMSRVYHIHHLSKRGEALDATTSKTSSWSSGSEAKR